MAGTTHPLCTVHLCKHLVPLVLPVTAVAESARLPWQHSVVQVVCMCKCHTVLLYVEISGDYIGQKGPPYPGSRLIATETTLVELWELVSVEC